MVPRHISQRAPATCSLGCGATCSCPCIHIYCPENSDPAGCCVTFLKLHVLEICLHIEHRHVSTYSINCVEHFPHTKQKKQQHNNDIQTRCCNDMARRSSTGDACLQAGPRRLRRKAHQLAEATVTEVMSVQVTMIDKSAGMVVEKDVREISVAAGMQGRGQG